MKTVLVAGASGLVGKSVVSLLKKKGFSVHTLSNSLSTDITKQRFHWSPEQGKIDIRCFDRVDHVVNLSGAGLFDHWWTKSYKEKIRKSRTQSTALLVDTILKHHYSIQTFVNASATGIYGADTGDTWLEESSPAGDDFLAYVVTQWEQSLFHATELKTRKVCLRFGIVLSDEGGALPQLSAPVKYGFGSAFGSGKQYISWIHIQDLAQMILFVIENKALEGAYNAVAPEPVTNATMIQGIADRLHKKLWAPNVPGLALNLVLGKERAATLLGGNRVKVAKMMDAGFQFQYKTLAEALHSFFSSKNNV
jgi:uncharacterized protein (TIGR01777 family)